MYMGQQDCTYNEDFDLNKAAQIHPEHIPMY